MIGRRASTFLVAAMMGVALIVATACRDDGGTDGTTAATASSTGAPTPAPTALPTAEPTVTPATTPIVGAFPKSLTGPVVVYTKQVRSTYALSRAWPTREVVTYDVIAKQELASFEVGGVGEYPADIALAGDKVIVNLEQQIVTYNLDGSRLSELRRAPPGGSIIGVAASRNGSRLALAEQTDPLCDPECRGYADITSVVFLDAASGDELLAVPQSAPGFAEFRGQAWMLTWRDDGMGVLVDGATYSERPGGTATVLLDGSVHTHDLRGFVYVAPNGRYACHGFDLPCMNVIGHGVSLRDLDSEVDVASVQDNGLIFGPGEWSPDSTGYLYSTYTAPASSSGTVCPQTAEGPLQWHLLHADGSPPSPVPDPEALRDQWYGTERPKLLCGDRVVPYAYCTDDRGVDQPVGLYFGDTKVDSGTDVNILGFIDPPGDVNP